MEQEEKLCPEMEAVREFSHLGDRVSAGGGRVVSVTARTKCGWVGVWECGDLLYGRIFMLQYCMEVKHGD